VSVYVVVVVGDTTSVPLVSSVPVQPPEAVHEVTLVFAQVKVVLPPKVTDAGFGVNVSVAVPGGLTPRLAVSVADPSAPVQVIV
jgi:hypothetical protein